MILILACSVCANSQLNYSLPNVGWVLLALLAWIIVTLPPRMREKPAGKVIAALLFWLFPLGFLYCGGGGNMVLLAFLVVTFLLQIVRDVRAWIHNRERRRNLIAAAVAVAFSVGIIVAGQIERSRLTAFERFMKYVQSGTALSRQLSREFASAPGFDPNILRSSLQDGPSDDAEKAFEILGKRNKVEDLVLLQDVVLSYPPSEFTSSGSSTWLWLWLNGLGAENITTKQELVGFIADHQTAPGEPAAAPAQPLVP